MLDMIRKIWRVGTVTRRQPFVKPPAKFPGLITLQDIPGTNWSECADACPTEAFTVTDYGVEINYGRCIFCGECAKICVTKAVFQTNNEVFPINKKEKLYLLLKFR